VALGIADDDDGLESRSLTGTCLLLYGLDLHDLVLKFGQEVVYNLVLLDGERVKVDLLHAGDLPGLDEATQLGDGLPLLLVVLTGASAWASSSAASASVAATVATGSESAATGSTSSSVCHYVPLLWLFLSKSLALDCGCERRPGPKVF